MISHTYHGNRIYVRMYVCMYVCMYVRMYIGWEKSSSANVLNVDKKVVRHSCDCITTCHVMSLHVVPGVVH